LSSGKKQNPANKKEVKPRPRAAPRRPCFIYPPNSAEKRRRGRAGAGLAQIQKSKQMSSKTQKPL